MTFCNYHQYSKNESKNDRICLGCDCWNKAGIEIMLMTKNFRQKDDEQFFKLLTRLRYNRLNEDDIKINSIKANSSTRYSSSFICFKCRSG